LFTVKFPASTLVFAYPSASLEDNLVKTIAWDITLALDIALGEIGFAYLFHQAFSVTFLFFDLTSILLQSLPSCLPSLD